MDVSVLAAVLVGALVPTAANAAWEWYLARGTRAYVDRRVRDSEAKAQKDRDSIFAEAKATRERVEALIAALQAPADVPPQSPGFAHGEVDPRDAVAAREAKKAEKKQRRMENAAAIAEALGEKALGLKTVMRGMGLDYDALLDSDDIQGGIAMAKRLMGKNGSNGNGNGRGLVSYVE